MAGAFAAAFGAGACAVDYTSLGRRPDGPGGAPAAPQCAEPKPSGCGADAPCPAGDTCVPPPDQACLPSSCECLPSGEWACARDCAGGVCVAGGPPASGCAGPPPPMGCVDDTQCPQGSLCGEDPLAGCAPLCECAESGEWSCSDGCAPGLCLPTPGGAPPLASTSRAIFTCGANDAPAFGWQIGLAEPTCSTSPSYPLLQLFPETPLPEAPIDENAPARVYPLGDGSAYLKGPGRGEWVAIESGWLEVQPRGVLAGRYDVVLADGVRLTGDFREEIDCRNLSGPCG